MLWFDLKKNCNQPNVHFISQGVDPNVFKPIKIQKKYDVVFGGNYMGTNFIGSDLRLKLVDHIIKLGYNIKVVGDGWPKEINSLPFCNFVEYNKIIISKSISQRKKSNPQVSKKVSKVE